MKKPLHKHIVRGPGRVLTDHQILNGRDTIFYFTIWVFIFIVSAGINATESRYHEPGEAWF